MNLLAPLSPFVALSATEPYPLTGSFSVLNNDEKISIAGSSGVVFASISCLRLSKAVVNAATLSSVYCSVSIASAFSTVSCALSFSDVLTIVKSSAYFAPV